MKSRRYTEEEEVNDLTKVINDYDSDPRRGKMTLLLIEFLKKYPHLKYNAVKSRIDAMRREKRRNPKEYDTATEILSKKSRERRHLIKTNENNLMVSRKEISFPYTDIRLEGGRVIITL
jgi:hypothetical protein